MTKEINKQLFEEKKIIYLNYQDALDIDENLFLDNSEGFNKNYTSK